MDWAKINEWLYVGNRNACGVAPVEACIHICRSDYPQNDCKRHQYQLQLEMDYRDGEELSPSLIANLVAFAAEVKKNKIPTLVHCHAGACRSPTIAGYVLGAVDGLHPIDAFAAVEKAIYDQQEKHDGGKMCNICYHPKKQLVRLMISAGARTEN